MHINLLIFQFIVSGGQCLSNYSDCLIAKELGYVPETGYEDYTDDDEFYDEDDENNVPENSLYLVGTITSTNEKESIAIIQYKGKFYYISEQKIINKYKILAIKNRKISIYDLNKGEKFNLYTGSYVEE